MASQPTYSSRMPFHGKRASSDVLFDKVVLKDNIFEDYHVQEDEKKKKGQARDKKKETEQQMERQDTPTLFQLDDVPKCKKRKQKKLMTQPSQKKFTRNKKPKTISKRDTKDGESGNYSSETADTSLTLNIESCCLIKQSPQAARDQSKKGHSKKNSEPTHFRRECAQKNIKKRYHLRGQAGEKRTEHVLTQDKTEEWSRVEKNLLEDREQSSMEIARDNSVIPLSILRKGSPLLPLVVSNLGGDSVDDLFTDKDDIDKMAWVSISSGPKDQHSLRDSSQYTFISTYSYGSTTAKSGTKTHSKSPTVFMRKKQPHLNSSVRMGKHDIKDMEFPDFISPICLEKAQPIAAKKTVTKVSTLCANENKLRKSSTLFLESDFCPVQLESPGLSTIASGIVQPHGQEEQKSYDIGRAKISGKAGCKVRASTPKDKAVLVSLNLSPVIMASWEEDELGLPVRDSIEVNTSEILVPSLMQITDLPRRDGSQSQVSQNNCEVQVPETIEKACPNTGTECQQLTGQNRALGKPDSNVEEASQVEMCDSKRKDSSCHVSELIYSCEQEKQNLHSVKIRQKLSKSTGNLEEAEIQSEENCFKKVSPVEYDAVGEVLDQDQQHGLCLSGKNESKSLPKQELGRGKNIASSIYSKKVTGHTLTEDDYEAMGLAKSKDNRGKSIEGPKECKSNFQTDLIGKDSNCGQCQDSALTEHQPVAEENNEVSAPEEDIGKVVEKHDSSPPDVGCLENESNSIKKSISDDIEVNGLNKSTYSKNPKLRLCFVNRLCKQHRQTQNVISSSFPFSESPNCSEQEIRQE